MISVVIPVFNGERFIERAVLSVINQTYKDIELIVVNDGSTDRTLEVLDELWKKYKPKGKIISIENSGSAHARNVGLDNISGDYFCLLDADDYFDTEIFEKVFKKYNSFDVCYYGYSNLDENGNLIKNYNDSFQFIDSLSGVEIAILKIKKSIWICHGSAIYNRKILEENSIRYIDGINHAEDFYFIISMLSCSNRVRCLDTNGLYIICRQNSVMRREYNSSFLAAIYSIDFLKKKIESLPIAGNKSELLELIDIQKMEHVCYVAKKIICSSKLNYYNKIKLIYSFSKSGFDSLPSLKNNIAASKMLEYYILSKSVVIYIFFVKIVYLFKNH